MAEALVVADAIDDMNVLYGEVVPRLGFVPGAGRVTPQSQRGSRPAGSTGLLR